MILVFSSFFKALGQMGSGAFLKVIFFGMVLALVLLAALTWGFWQSIYTFFPDMPDVPISKGAEWVVVMLVMSIFLMIPVASLFSGMFLDEVANAVETRHYPFLAPANGQGFYEGLKSGINFLGIVILINVIMLVIYFTTSFAGLLVFWIVNGYLLGREYFVLVALRRMKAADLKIMRRRNWGIIWFAGFCMAIPLSIPVLNLFIPVLGVATYTHIFHGLQKRIV